jgi:hypothetical protein
LSSPSADDVAPQILPERLAQLVVIFGEQRFDRLELSLAPRRRASTAGKEKLALPRDQSGVIGGGHVH